MWLLSDMQHLLVLNLSFFSLHISSDSEFPLCFKIFPFAFSLFWQNFCLWRDWKLHLSLIGIRYASPSFPPPSRGKCICNGKRNTPEQSCCCQMLRLLATCLLLSIRPLSPHFAHANPMHCICCSKLAIEIPTGFILFEMSKSCSIRSLFVLMCSSSLRLG